MTQQRQPPESSAAGLLHRGAGKQQATRKQSVASAPGALASSPPREPAAQTTRVERPRLRALEQTRPFRSLETRPKRPRPEKRRIPFLPRFLITAVIVGIIWFLAMHFGHPPDLPSEPQPTPAGTQTPTLIPAIQIRAWPTSAVP